MMKKIYLTLLIIFPFLLFSQNYTKIENLNFVNYTPLWSHLVIDSSFILHNVNNGTDQLFPTFGLPLYFENNELYCVSAIINDDWEGYYIEKLDIIDGKKLWGKPMDLRNCDKKIVAQALKIDEGKNVNIISLRNILDLDIIPFGTKTHLSNQKFSSQNGILLSNSFPSDSSEVEEKFLFPYGDSKWFYPENNYINVICQKQSINDLNMPAWKYYRNIYDLDGNLIEKSKDTFFMSTNPDLTGGIELRSTKCFYQKDSSYVIFHGGKSALEPENWSTIEIIKIDKNWNLIKRLDLRSIFSIPNSFKFCDINNDTMLLANYQSNENNYQYKYAVLDINGNVIETINLPVEYNYSVKKEILTKDHRILISMVNSNHLQFFLSNGGGTLNQILDLELENPTLIYRPIDLYITDDNNLIIRGSLRNDTIINGFETYVGNWNYLLSIDGKDLNIKTSTHNINSINNLTLSPNPTQSALHIECNISGTYKLEISDMLGMRIKSVKISKDNEKDIDVISLKTGIYIAKLIDEYGNLQAMGKFLKL